jgi:ribose transport system ATP-binding protein
MSSSDIIEVLGMSDRVAVLREGELAGILNREEASEEAVLRLATPGIITRGEGGGEGGRFA